MLTLLAIATAVAALRIAISAIDALRRLPRRNEDMALF